MHRDVGTLGSLSDQNVADQSDTDKVVHTRESIQKIRNSTYFGFSDSTVFSSCRVISIALSSDCPVRCNLFNRLAPNQSW
jgi:hypothetical protein